MEPLEIKRCNRCILPGFYPQISFDDDGICSFCKEESAKSPIDWKARRIELDRIITEAKSRKLPYDVLVPWSGGKDSTYTIYVLKKEFDCKILAVNFHNGFQSEDAAKNMTSVSECLGFDLITLRPDWKLLRKIYQLFLKTKGELCTVCNTVGYAIILSFAARQAKAFGDSPLVIGGWSKILEAMPGADHFNYQMFADILKLEDDLLSDFESSPLIDKSICEILRGMDDPRSSIGTNKNLLNRAFQLPEYIEWNPDAFTPILLKETGYSIPETGLKNHFDCIITPVAIDLFRKEWGFDQSVTSLSVMIRNNLISRQEALECVGVNKKEDPDLLEFFLNRIDIKPEEISITKH